MPVRVYKGDDTRIVIRNLAPEAVRIPAGERIEGVLFDGYPQLVKDAGSRPAFEVEAEKNIMVSMRDGARIAVDVYRPKAGGEKFPAILAWGIWGKDMQEAIRWQADKPQAYYDSPFWDGTLEAGNFMYTVPRGYAHVIPDPRGIGNSDCVKKPLHDGVGGVADSYAFEVLLKREDIYDLIEWIAAQPWCNGSVGMMGPSAYSAAQIEIGPNPPPALKALHPDANPMGAGDHFHGIYDTLFYHILMGRHGNDSSFPVANRVHTMPRPFLLDLAGDDLQARLAEALAHPDIKYNSKWQSYLRYPMKSAYVFDSLLGHFHPAPGQDRIFQSPDIPRITLPIYLGAPWAFRFYLHGSFEVYQQAGTPPERKKLLIMPPGEVSRPYTGYHDETIRWFDYWLKGIDTGIMDEPPIKMFIMGVNKWRFESEWPLARTRWQKLYLHPGGRLSSDSVAQAAGTESFTQPAPYLDPTVYCLTYTTDPFTEETEFSGPLALYLDAAIDHTDTNWIVDLVLIRADGSRQLISNGCLKAGHRALDETRSKPYEPIHPQQDPVPVTPGKVERYAIAMLSMACIFGAGERMELVIRNQDDILSRLGAWGVYLLPFMTTVSHQIHFGESHLLAPRIPPSRQDR